MKSGLSKIYKNHKLKRSIEKVQINKSPVLWSVTVSNTKRENLRLKRRKNRSIQAPEPRASNVCFEDHAESEQLLINRVDL